MGKGLAGHWPWGQGFGSRASGKASYAMFWNLQSLQPFWSGPGYREFSHPRANIGWSSGLVLASCFSQFLKTAAAFEGLV